MGKRDERKREQEGANISSIFTMPRLLLLTCGSERRCRGGKDVGRRFLRSPGFARVVGSRGALRWSWYSFGHAKRICSRLRERCEVVDDESWTGDGQKRKRLALVAPEVNLFLLARFCTLSLLSPYSTQYRAPRTRPSTCCTSPKRLYPAPSLKRFFPSRPRSGTSSSATLGQLSQQGLVSRWNLHTQATAARSTQILGAFAFPLSSRPTDLDSVRRDGEAPIVIYGYIPSRALGCIGAIVFALAFVTHFALFLRLRGTRVFQGLLALGCVMEVVGYCMRIMSHCECSFPLPSARLSKLDLGS